VAISFLTEYERIKTNNFTQLNIFFGCTPHVQGHFPKFTPHDQIDFRQGLQFTLLIWAQLSNARLEIIFYFFHFALGSGYHIVPGLVHRSVPLCNFASLFKPKLENF